MAELCFKTIKNAPAQGKPKVLFSCHPDDFQETFPLIIEDIFEFADCSIWYVPDGGSLPVGRELEDLLDDMQLVVFAVTARFLHCDSVAKDHVLPMALNLHVPILPIMLETGLEWDFNKICAEVQLVNRNVTDPTATPYKEVLKTFLGAVLVGDEMAQKVRDAFDAYVFLSYRKKDRSHAKRLMRLIHENPDFRDIAIWYDEYLVPGEDFNDAIREAFDKSSLFALAVTPHLLEEGNYVKEVEYKIAHKRYESAHQKKEGSVPEEENDRFEIVPVELYEKDTKKERTDMAELADAYEGISNVQDEHQREKTKKAFVDALERIGKNEKDGDSQHRFFIGLAYLCGIDVEKNYERALKLLESAALDKSDPDDEKEKPGDNPCFEATEKLVDMYLRGEGVQADLNEAIHWQKILIDQYKVEFEKNYSPDEHKGFGTKYMKSLVKLSDLYRKSKCTDEAMKTAKQAMDIAEQLVSEVGAREAERDRAMISNRIGRLYRDQKDYDKAAEYFQIACKSYEKLTAEMGTRRARRDLSVSYELLGDICNNRGEYSLAVESFQKAYEIRKKLVDERSTHGARRDFSAIITKLGNYYKKRNEPDKALDYYKQALKIDETLFGELKTRNAWDDYAVSLSKVGNIYRKRADFTTAIRYLEEAKSIYGELKEESPLLRYKRNYATCCEKLASAYKHSRQREKAEEQFKEAIEIRELLAQNDRSADSENELAASYFNYAAFKKDKEPLKKALAIWEKLSVRHPEYKRYIQRCIKGLEQLT